MECSKNRLIHIIDDNPFIREFLAELVESCEYIVECFSNPTDYLEKVNSDSFIQPVATFVDVIMPNMNGYEMIGALHPANPEMKFVIMSGELDIRDENKHLVCMFLRKPFYPTCVQEVLEKLSRCHSCGASPDIGCASSDHRGYYDLKAWSCPQQ